MNTFVTWLWQSRTRDFQTSHVNVLYSMLDRFCDLERLICITDTPDGLDRKIDVLPMPETGLEHVMNPELKAWPFKKFPSCYRRLWLFSEEAKQLGDRIISIDIDVIIVRECAHLFETEASFKGWSDPEAGWNKIAGGIFMLETGAHTGIWEDFDPETSPDETAAAGFRGSDQAYLAYKMYPLDEFWTNKDGIKKINWTPKHLKEPPDDVNIVFTNGHKPPWCLDTKVEYPWVRDHWK